ncbi:MAG: protein-L-isoaspartate(D-aspartate) O-methyltransferase [Bacteroidota bacterium]
MKPLKQRIIILLWLLSFQFTGCIAQPETDKSYKSLRETMVNTQIAARGVKDKKVLNAMRSVPRHLFVPRENRRFAYSDFPLPIGEGQTISQPYIVALMTELLLPRESDKILEVGTGSGYQAAVLAEIVDSVFTIEIYPSLAESAKQLLKELEYNNVVVKAGDGYKGWKEHAPFNGIIVTCSPADIPEPLEEQLAEGGRMIIPVGEGYNQELVIVTKEKGKLKRKKVLPVRFVPMIDDDGTRY